MNSAFSHLVWSTQTCPWNIHCGMIHDASLALSHPQHQVSLCWSGLLNVLSPWPILLTNSCFQVRANVTNISQGKHGLLNGESFLDAPAISYLDDIYCMDWMFDYTKISAGRLSLHSTGINSVLHGSWINQQFLERLPGSLT